MLIVRPIGKFNHDPRPMLKLCETGANECIQIEYEWRENGSKNEFMRQYH